MTVYGSTISFCVYDKIFRLSLFTYSSWIYNLDCIIWTRAVAI
jgi:hypothetical protein